MRVVEPLQQREAFTETVVEGDARLEPQVREPVADHLVARTLPKSRLSFGADKLELRHGDERRYAAFIDIHEYADAVEPGVLRISAVPRVPATPRERRPSGFTNRMASAKPGMGGMAARVPVAIATALVASSRVITPSAAMTSTS